MVVFVEFSLFFPSFLFLRVVVTLTRWFFSVGKKGWLRISGGGGEDEVFWRKQFERRKYLRSF